MVATYQWHKTKRVIVRVEYVSGGGHFVGTVVISTDPEHIVDGMPGNWDLRDFYPIPSEQMPQH